MRTGVSFQIFEQLRQHEILYRQRHTIRQVSCSILIFDMHVHNCYYDTFIDKLLGYTFLHQLRALKRSLEIVSSNHTP
jgi:hypothetical protein